MFEDLYQQRSDVEADLENGRGDQDALLQKLTALNRAIDGDAGGPEDPLVDKWERELEMGLIPDLNEGVDAA
jgi:hypothetical protein